MGWLHLPTSGDIRGCAVLCPPVGDESLSAHRTLRHLAGELADVGIAAFRFDYRGTGDSAGDELSKLQVAGWIDSVVAAVDYTRSLGVPIALVGMRLGATLADAALSRCQPIIGQVWWDPCESGTSFLREQRALHRMSLGAAFDESDGSVEALGVTYYPRTVADLKALQLSDMGATGTDTVPTLVLTRDDRPLTSRVQALIGLPFVRHTIALGQRQLLDVTRAVAEVPVDAVATVTHYVNELMPTERVAADRPPATLEAVVVADGDTGDMRVRERIVHLGASAMFAVIAEPVGVEPKSTVVFLNTLEHHVGPNRLWVDISRQGAAAGLRMVRLDRVGLGESSATSSVEDPLPYDATFLADVCEAAGALAEITRDQSSNTPSELSLVGMCVGAWAAAMAGPAATPRAVYLLNQVIWADEPGFPRGGPVERVDLSLRELWQNKLRTTMRARIPYAALRRAARRGLATIPETHLSRLVGKGIAVTLLFSANDRSDFARQRGEEGVRRLRRRAGRVEIVELAGADHNLMYRPARRLIADRLVEMLITDAAGDATIDAADVLALAWPQAG